jgi:predicted porin
MKFKGIAAASFVMLSCHTVHAQSSVTFYGIADAFFGQRSALVGGAKVTQGVVDSDGLFNSRWGLKGTEDLGGGLKAEFVAESLFNISNGATLQVATAPTAAANQLFSSQAWVGLSGGFGAIRLGRQVTPFHSFRGATDNLYDSTAFSTTGTGWSQGSVSNYLGRFDNAISYETPTFGGVSGKVALSFGENKTSALSATTNTSLNIKYVEGPVMAGYSYQKQGAQGGTADTDYNFVGGSYDFGVARVVGAVNRARFGTAKDNEWQVGVSVPLGAASVAAGYARSKGNVNGPITTTSSGQSLALLGTYDMSKRTRLYVAWKKTTGKNLAGTTLVENSVIGAGISHKF